MRRRPHSVETGWTLETLHAHFSTLIEEKDQRHQRQLDAMDLRYQQRYDAQNKALDAALLSAEKAVTTALTAAEKAVAKAEVAAEKRFDAVNEFRGAYQDIIAQQMPRAEAEQRLTAMAEKINDLKLGSHERKGQEAGLGKGGALLVAALGVVLTLLLIYNLISR